MPTKTQAPIAEGVELMDTHQMARRTGFSEVTLRRWRVLGGGPPFMRLGSRSVRYHPRHVEEWALDNLVDFQTARGGTEKPHGNF